MKVAILSFSSLVQRKVIPALLRFPLISSIDIFTRRSLDSFKNELPSSHIPISFFTRSDFDKVKSGFYSFVYISSSNEFHLSDIESCLSTNHHTLVDKPAFLDSTSAHYYINSYKQSNLYLHEVIPWTYHRQYSYFKSFVKNNSVTHALATFTVPAFPPDNFRVSSSEGRGVFHDMNAYAFSLADLLSIPYSTLSFSFAGDDPQNQDYFILESSHRQIKLFSLFGFGFPYTNRLMLSSISSSIVSDRIFSSDPSLSPPLYQQNHPDSFMIDVIDDSFYNFLSVFLNMLSSKPSPDSLFYHAISSKYSTPIFSSLHD